MGLWIKRVNQIVNDTCELKISEMDNRSEDIIP